MPQEVAVLLSVDNFDPFSQVGDDFPDLLNRSIF